MLTVQVPDATIAFRTKSVLSTITTLNDMSSVLATKSGLDNSENVAVEPLVIEIIVPDL